MGRTKQPLLEELDERHRERPASDAVKEDLVCFVVPPRTRPAFPPSGLTDGTGLTEGTGTPSSRTWRLHRDCDTPLRLQLWILARSHCVEVERDERGQYGQVWC